MKLPDGTVWSALVAQEKGIDIRIALDVIRMARQDEFDVAVVFSQDQDFSELSDEIRSLSKEQGRWIKIVSAFPTSPTSRNGYCLMIVLLRYNPEEWERGDWAGVIKAPPLWVMAALIRMNWMGVY